MEDFRVLMVWGMSLIKVQPLKSDLDFASENDPDESDGHL